MREVPFPQAKSYNVPTVSKWLVEVVQFLAAAFCGLAFGAALIMASGTSPVVAYGALFQGALGSLYGLSETLVSTTPLVFAGLAVAFAFHSGLFNIGVEGQLVMGALAAGWAGFAIKGLPPFIHLPLAIGLGMAAGASWSALAGFLKARLGVHEVISTIMLNYIAFDLSTYMVSPSGPLKAPGQLPATPLIQDSARLFPLIADTRLSAGILIALAVVVLDGYLLWGTRLGYRIRTVGKSPTAAEYAGISPQRHMMIAMAISGAMAGLAGVVEVLGIDFRFYGSFSPGYGFDGIAIALLGQLHPVGILASALLFGILRAGSIEMQQAAGVSADIISAISGVIIFFVALRVVLPVLMARRNSARTGR
ncbi:MAG: ABC transporter permease [Chloroflexi bacterium]|nr:ABC transporter permease [Chloroflexota bacterium]